MNLIEKHKTISPPKGVPVWNVDPFELETLKNPYDFYRELLEKGPFVYIPKYSILVCGKHEIVKEVFSDWRRFVSSRGIGLQDYKYSKPFRKPSIILEAEPPQHTISRKVMARVLSPKSVKKMMSSFEESAETIIEKLINLETFDAISELAESFPTDTFPSAVGMLDRDPRKMIDYGAMIFNSLGPDGHLKDEAMSKASDIVPWITAACARNRLTKNGIGSEIYKAADDGEIDLEQASMLVRSLLSAGIDSTVSSIGSTIWCLANNPSAFEALKQNPDLARPCFEEVLRFTSPAHSFSRTTVADTNVAGIEIVEDTKILCVLGAANRDPDKWANPDKFIINRKPVGHLAFGAGIHGCVGQNIARAEVEALLKVIAKKVNKIILHGPVKWRPNNAIRALEKMQVSFN